MNDLRDVSVGTSNREGLLALESLPPGRRAVILIHGFANSQEKADSSFRTFFSRVQDCLSPHPAYRFATLIGFHWPGDHRLWGISQATYSSRIGVAQTSGIVLAKLLGESQFRDKQVVLVAHSLGCGVLLATLKEMGDKGKDWHGASIVAAYLLAAAVPVDLCIDPSGLYKKRYPEVRCSVFYSHRDMVLWRAFGPGQLIFDRLTQAVGRFGLPERDRWDARASTGLGHGKYWPSKSIAENVTRAVSPWGMHYLPVRPYNIDALEDIEWELLTSRRLSEHTLPTR